MTALFIKRFTELEQQLAEIEATKTMRANAYTGTHMAHIDHGLILNWSVKVKSLLERACGVESSHVKTFIVEEKPHSLESNASRLERMKAVFLAAKEDFEGGHLNTFRNLVQAEVFGSELEQASELLLAGYASAAAVITGVVLETTVRNLCTDHGLDHGKLDKMNADLAKASVYNSIQQKRITAMAGIRNAAAHGDTDKFNAGDVKGMIDDVERFLTTTLQ
jgi:hypothetical protein